MKKYIIALLAVLCSFGAHSQKMGTPYGVIRVVGKFQVDSDVYFSKYANPDTLKFLRVRADGTLEMRPAPDTTGYGLASRYWAGQNFASLSGSYSNPSWISSLAWAKVTGAPTNVSSFTNDAGYLTSSSALNATNLLSGTIPAARYGSGTIDVSKINASGTATSGTYLRGDGSWQAAGSAGIQSAPWTKQWPFTRDYTYLYKIVDDTMTISPASGGGTGGAVRAVMVADGVHTPAFDTLFTLAAGAWVNTAGQTNLITAFKDTTGYNLYIALGKIVSVPDIIPPTVVSATATDSHTVHIVFSEAVTGTTAGYSFSNGSPLTISSRTGSGTSAWDFTISQAMASSDVITRSYNSGTGNSVDVSSNPLGSYTSQSVTNAINAPPVYLTFPTTNGSITESPTHTFSSNSVYAVAGEVITGNGNIEAEVASTTNNAWGFGLDEDSTLQGISGWKWYVFLLGSNIYADQNGGGGVNTGIAYTLGMKIRITRTGDDVNSTYWDGTTWQPLYDFTQDATTGQPLYPKLDFYGGGTGTVKNVIGQL